MKGYVELSYNNGMRIIKSCRTFMSKPIVYEIKTYQKFSLIKFKWVDCEYKVVPYWYGDKKQLFDYLGNLEEMLNLGDKVNMSLLCYENLIKLSNGDKDTNSTYILNY